MSQMNALMRSLSPGCTRALVSANVAFSTLSLLSAVSAAFCWVFRSFSVHEKPSSQPVPFSVAQIFTF